MSTAQTAAELAELARNADDLRGLLGRYAGTFNGGASRAEIHINAGGVGVWIATTACLVMLGVLVIGALWMQRELTRVDAELIAIRERAQAQQGYLNAIYRAAPNLQPAEQKTQPEKK
jgi:heme exporter protein D